MSAPDIGRRPIPPFPGWQVALGPGLVWIALAQASGELIWWPYLVAKYGLAFLVLLVPACLLQYPLNLEIGRYTLLTGESVFRGFIGLSRAVGVALWMLMTLSFLWFGAFASAAGTALAALTMFPITWSVRGRTLFWGYAMITVLVTALASSRTAYRIVELFMKVVAFVAIVGLFWACLSQKVVERIPTFLGGLVGLGGEMPRIWDPADATKLLTAISFAGLGGFWILLYSYWLRDRGSGMATYGERVNGLLALSDRSGPARSPDAIRIPEERTDSRTAWSRWQRYLTVDASLGILDNLLVTLLTCLLAWTLLFPARLLPEGYDLAVVQSRFFEVIWGSTGRVVFLIVASAALMAIWLATADGASRMQADVLTALFPTARRYSMARLYWVCLGVLTAVTCITMPLADPGTLILLSTVIGFTGTVVFPVALYFLNYRQLPSRVPPWARPRARGALLLLTSFLCYLTVAVLYLREVFR